MAQWLKDSVLDVLGFGDNSPAPTPRYKRRATSDRKWRHKAARYDGAAYRSAPYVTYSGQVKGTYYRPGSTKQPPKAPLRVAPTAEKVVSYSDDKGVSSTGTDLPAGFGTDEEAFEPVIPKANFQRMPRTPSVHEVTASPSTSKASLVRKVSSAPAAESFAQIKSSTTKASAPKKKDPRLTNPIRKAHDVANMGPNPRWLIQRDVGEPEYALRDIEIRDGITKLRTCMSSFSKHLFSSKVDEPETALTSSFFAKFSAETAKVIGCVASGGPGGVEEWKEMFSDTSKRRALVCAIVGNVVTEQVFQHMFFGGIPENVMDVARLQEVHKDEDGFDRNVHYATHIRSILDTHCNGELDLPSNFSNHVNFVVGALITHLAPILSLNPGFNTKSMIIELHEIVTHAGILSLAMRIDPHTVYHFEPVFKEDTFSSKRTECFNTRDMEQTNPHTNDDHALLREREKARRAGLSSVEKRRAKNDDPLTQITIMDGVTVYRKGGWETADSEVLKVKYERTEFRDQGVRARMLAPGWVFCRWGRAREFKDGKSADVAKTHGVTWNGGFKEFADVEGVVDWIGLERAEREKNREAVLEKGGGKGKAPVGS